MIPEKWMSQLERFENSEKLDVMVFVLFLIPGLPKDVFTYLVPLTNMSMRNFVVLANIGRIPGVLISTLAPTSLSKGITAKAPFCLALRRLSEFLRFGSTTVFCMSRQSLDFPRRRALIRRNKRIRKMRGAVRRTGPDCYT